MSQNTTTMHKRPHMACLFVALLFVVVLMKDATVAMAKIDVVEEGKDTTTTSSNGDLQLLQIERSFFQQLVSVVSQPKIAKAMTDYTFPATGGSCPPVSINAGKWFENVQFPTDTATLNAPSSSSNTFDLQVSKATIVGLSGKTSWTSLVNATWGTGSWKSWSCFQICFGASPFSAVTNFTTSVEVQNSFGTKTTVTIPFSNVLHDSWLLNDIPNKCVGSQSQFDQSFNTAVGPTLAKNGPTLASLMQQSINNVLANSSTQGFGVKAALSPSSATDGPTSTQGSLTLQTNADIPSTILAEFESTLPNNKAPTVKMAVQTAASASAAYNTSTPTCVTLTPCTPGPGVGENGVTLPSPACGACLQKRPQDGKVYVAVAASMGIDQQASFQKQRNVETNSGTKVVAHSKQLLGQNFVEKQQDGGARRTAGTLSLNEKKIDFTAKGPLTNTRVHFSKTLFESVLSTASVSLAGMLKKIAVSPMPHGPLVGAEKYCGMSHQGFTWGGIQSTIPVLVHSINKQNEQEQQAIITIRLPQLASLQGSSALNVNCLVDMPLGSPLQSVSTGTFAVSMSSDFEIDLLVDGKAGTVSVQRFPTTKFNATLSYDKATGMSLFDPYVHGLLTTTVAENIVKQMNTLIPGEFSDALLSRVSEVFNTFSSTSSTSSKDEGSADLIGVVEAASGGVLGTSLTVEPNAAATSPPIATTLVEAMGSATNNTSPNFGFLTRVTTAPTFTLREGCVEDLSTCSTSQVLPSPLSSTLQLSKCVACLRLSKDKSHVLVGTTSDASFVSAGTQRYNNNNKLAELEKKLLIEQKATMSSSSQTKEKELVKSVVADPTATPHPSTRTSNTTLYLGTGVITQATVMANDPVTSALKAYAHNVQVGRGLPQFEAQCNISHSGISWQAVPPIDVVVKKVFNTQSRSSATLRVALRNLPKTLQTNTMQFGTGCSVNVDLPVQFVTSQTGTSVLTLAFDGNVDLDGEIVMDLNVAFSEGANGVVALTTNMTTFAVSATYAYDGATSTSSTTPSTQNDFLFDPYIGNYLQKVLVDEVTSEFKAVLEEQVWTAVEHEVTAFLGTAKMSSTCNITAFEASHLVLSSGSSCGQNLPLPSPIDTSSVMYVIDGGAMPNQKPPVAHTTKQTLAQCSSVIPVAVVSKTGQTVVGGDVVAFTNCSTVGSVYNGHVIISIDGNLPLS